MNLKMFELFKVLPQNVDGILIFDAKLRFYYSEFNSSEGLLFITRNEVFLLLDSRYFELAKQTIKNCNVVLCEDGLFKKMQQLFKLNKCKLVVCASKNLNVKTYNFYKSHCNLVKLILDEKLDKLIETQQSIKSNVEIENISLAQKVVEKAFNEVLNLIKPGISELEIAGELNSLIYKESEGVAFETIVLSGIRTSFPHGFPTTKKIEKGDFVLIDCGAVINGYCSDMTRTLGVKQINNLQREIYEIVLTAQKKAINLIVEGVNCVEIDCVVRNFFKEFGLEKNFCHSLGHGIGLNVHEEPFFQKNGVKTLKKNMVLTIEPGIYLKNKFGVRIEDMILVKENGFENLTSQNKELICI